MIIHYPFFGGPHNQAVRLNEPLQRLGISTTVVLPGETGNAAARLRSAGLDVAELRLHRMRARLDPRFHALIRERSVDVVEINGLVNAQGAVAARLVGIPVIWQLLDTRAPKLVKQLLMPVVKSLADVVMSTGYGVADVHPGARSFGDRWVPFYPPVDTATFRPGADRRKAARLVVAEGVTGHLVQPANTEAMVKAVVGLLDDPERLTRAASEARSRAVRRYDVETCAEVHLEAIQKAVAHKARGGRP